MIKVYLVDDHSVVIEGIYSLLQHEKEIVVTGHASNADNCLQYFITKTTDIILMDFSLPDMSGVDLCKAIKKNYPGILVIALSTFNQGTYIRKMMESGASGYLLKNAGKQEITDAIKTVYGGKTYLSFEASKALSAESKFQTTIPSLTKREKEVLLQIAEGLTNFQIAEKLFISVDTVDSHRKNLHTKLNVTNTAMLVRTAIDNHLLE
jgi:DNA-binding NarL/FixJ family response regulator